MQSANGRRSGKNAHSSINVTVATLLLEPVLSSLASPDTALLPFTPKRLALSSLVKIGRQVRFISY
jgi:hypothetical protein